jgi:hypothetical protein
MSPHRSSELLNDILAVVDRLTQPHTTTVIMEHDDGSEYKVHVEHDPLLKQLRDAVRSSTGARPNGGGLPNERNVIDSDALEQYHAIVAQIDGLYAEVTDAKPFKSPDNTLRNWYIGFSDQVRKAKISTDLVVQKYRKLNSVAASIEAKLNPPTVLEITAPCPRCSADYGTDEQGVHRRAVMVESRIVEYRSLDHTRARCVVCGATWLHGRGMRQLRYEIDQAEILRHADNQTVEQMYEQPAILVSAGIQARPKTDGRIL